jgi:hypothetical protein
MPVARDASDIRHARTREAGHNPQIRRVRARCRWGFPSEGDRGSPAAEKCSAIAIGSLFASSMSARSGSRGQDDPRHGRQLRRPQASQCSAMARTSSAMDAPFHADVRVLAQRDRGLLRDPDKAHAQPRRLSIRRRPANRHQPLPRRPQSAIATLHLDRQPRQNHRRGQARAHQALDSIHELAKLDAAVSPCNGGSFEKNKAAAYPRGSRHEVRLHCEAPFRLVGGIALRSARPIEVRLPCLAETRPGTRSREDDGIMPAMTEPLGRAHTRRGIRSERNREIGGLTMPRTELIPAANVPRRTGPR